MALGVGWAAVLALGVALMEIDARKPGFSQENEQSSSFNVHI